MILGSCVENTLAVRCEIKFYPAPIVGAEGKALIVRKRDAGDLRVALGAGQYVVPSCADGRSRPKAKIAYKKLT